MRLNKYFYFKRNSIVKTLNWRPPEKSSQIQEKTEEKSISRENQNTNRIFVILVVTKLTATVC